MIKLEEAIILCIIMIGQCLSIAYLFSLDSLGWKNANGETHIAHKFDSLMALIWLFSILLSYIMINPFNNPRIAFYKSKILEFFSKILEG